DELAAVLRAAPPGWIRGVGYHESVAGDLDRWVLDELVATQPVRVQHRGGALWMLNTAALAATGLESAAPDGRLFRADDLLRSVVPTQPLDLTAVGRLLTNAGVTGVTDATPDLDAGVLVDSPLPQHITVLGARKIVLD